MGRGEEKKEEKYSVSECRITDLKEQLANQKQRMDHALKLADQALSFKPPPWIYVVFKGTIYFIPTYANPQEHK